MNRLSVRSNQTKLVYCRMGAAVMKSNSCQRRVELALTLIVEHELVKRAVVAEVSRHAVKAGAEQPSRVLLLLLRVEIDAGTLRHEEGVGEGRAEAARRRPRSARRRPDRWERPGPAAAAVPGASPAGRSCERAAGVTHPVRHVLAILPEHERLGAVLNPGGGQVLDLRRELLGGARRRSRASAHSRPGRRPAACLRERRGARSRHSACSAAIGPASSGRCRQGGPDRRKVPGTEAGRGGEVRQRCLRPDRGPRGA